MSDSLEDQKLSEERLIQFYQEGQKKLNRELQLLKNENGTRQEQINRIQVRKYFLHRFSIRIYNVVSSDFSALNALDCNFGTCNRKKSKLLRLNKLKGRENMKKWTDKSVNNVEQRVGWY